MIDFELGYRVLCIKDYETIKSGNHYQITGSGDFTMMYDTDKKGFGFSVVDEAYGWMMGKGPFSGEKTYFFTEEEMPIYFMSIDAEWKSKKRQEKINSILK